MDHSFARRVACAVLALMALVACQPAFAHAQLLSVAPPANAVLDQAPESIRFDFNEPVSPLVISLIAPNGSATDLTAAALGGQTLIVPLPADLGQGTHVLSWRVVSIDAHPVAGSLVFSIGHVSGDGALNLSTGSLVTASLLWGSKLIVFVGLFMGIGGAVFALSAPLPAQAHRAIAGFALVGLSATPLSLGLHGADALGLTPDALASANVWITGFSTSYGMTALLLAAAFILALLALFILPSLAWLAWPLAAASLAISGHAGAAAPQWLTRCAVTLHIGGILFWVGALLPLWFWMRDRTAQADLALARFSRFVPFAVAPIILSGLVLAIIQLGPPGRAWLTAYGYILAAKLLLLAVLFGLALWNRFSLTQPALAGDITARDLLRRSILAEIGLVLVIFALAAAWRFTPPPRAIAETMAAQAALAIPAYAHAMDDKVMADIVIAPGRAGPVSIDISIVDTAGNPAQPMGVDVTFGAPTPGLEPFTVPARLADGVWHLDDLTIPFPGTWDLTLAIRRDRFTLSRIGTEIDLN